MLSTATIAPVLLTSKEIRVSAKPYVYAISVAQIKEWLNAFSWSLDRGKVAYDVETTGLDPITDRLVLIQLKIDSLPCLIIDCRHIPLHQVAKLIEPILMGKEYLKIIHNAKFDVQFTLCQLGVPIERIFDTMLAEQLLNAGLNRSSRLKDVSFSRLGVVLDKSLQTSFIDANPMEILHNAYATEPPQHRPTLTPEQLAYAAMDTDVLFPIMRMQVAELRKHNMLKVAQLEFSLVLPLSKAEIHGVKIHTERWRNHIQMLDREREAIEGGLVDELTPYVEKYRKARYGESMFQYKRHYADWQAQHDYREACAAAEKERSIEAGLSKGEAQKALNAWKKSNPPPKKPQMPQCGEGPINLGSPDQLQGALDVMGVELPRKPSGALETDHKALSAAAGTWPIIDEILKWREYSKLVSAFGENILEKLDKDSRLHPDFNQIVSTGRMSCRNPNVQQIPGADKELGKEFRRSFIADQGCLLVAADYSQIELRVLAEVTRDANLIAAFESGIDLHTQTAALMFGLPLEGLKELHPDKRKAAKTINFGIMYGLGPRGLAQQLGIEQGQAREYINMYYEAYPGVFEWKEAVQKEGIGNLFSTTMLGRRRFFPPLPIVEKPRYREDPMWEGRAIGGSSQEAMHEYKRIRAGYERMMGNMVIQGTSADITKQAVINIDAALDVACFDASIVMVVHDEIVLESSADCAEDVAILVVEEMKRAAQQFLTHVPVEVSYAVGEYWEH